MSTPNTELVNLHLKIDDVAMMLLLTSKCERQVRNGRWIGHFANRKQASPRERSVENNQGKNKKVQKESGIDLPTFSVTFRTVPWQS